MKRNKNFKELEFLLSFLNPQGKKEDLSAINKTENPNDILSLISKYEKSAVEIKNSGGEGLDDILNKLSKLRILLSNLFKKKQQKLLDLHWEKIQEENAKFSKKMREDLEIFRKQLEFDSKYIYKTKD